MFHVLYTEHLDESAAAWLGERVRLERVGLDDGRLDSALATADGIIVRTYTQVDAEFLNKAPNLKVVARAGVGVDNIDLAQCRSQGIVVVNSPGANTQAVVEFAFAMVLDRIRPRIRLEAPLDQAGWNALRNANAGRVQLDECTLGLLGMGQIGRRMAQVGRGFGMRVIYHDLLTIPAEHRNGAEPVDLDELLHASDVLSLHVDGRAENQTLIGASALAQMKPSVILVNAARGFLVDSAALARFLIKHPEATAILDVHDPEPITADNELLPLSNAILTPHLGGRTHQAMARMSDVVYDVWRVLNGDAPEHAVEAS